MGEQQVYGFVKQHRSIIKELGGVFALVNDVLEVLKKKGLSYSTIAACLAKCRASANQGVSRVKALVNKIKDYLKAEQVKLPDRQTVWHASSDIIESLFGFYKSRKAPNSLHGVTAFVLALPLLTKAGTTMIALNFKEALQAVYMKELKQWSRDQLVQNQVVKRNKTFKNDNRNP